MPPSNNPNRYRDVQPIIDIALDKGECVYEAATKAEATTVAHRLNTLIRIHERLNPLHPILQFMVSRTNDTTLTVTKRKLHGKIITPHEERAPTPVDPLADAEALLAALENENDT